MAIRKKRDDPKPRVLLDSGAFSAWSSGAEVNLKDYLQYLENNADIFDGYFALDVIWGARGKPLTLSDLQEGAAASWKNYKTMKKAGFDPIPVFHQGERIDWLRKIVDDGATYIGIGTRKDSPLPTREAFIRLVFDTVVGRSGFPSIRLHGLGISSFDLIAGFPWFSVDHSSAMLSARGRSVVAKTPSGLRSFYAGGRTGKTQIAVEAGYRARVFATAKAWRETPVPVERYHSRGLAGKGIATASTPLADRIRIYQVVGAAKEWPAILREAGETDYLMSFHHHADWDIRRFVAGGKV